MFFIGFHPGVPPRRSYPPPPANLLSPPTPPEALLTRTPKIDATLENRIICLLMNYLQDWHRPTRQFRGRSIFNVESRDGDVIHQGEVGLDSLLIQNCGLATMINNLHTLCVKIQIYKTPLPHINHEYSLLATIRAFDAGGRTIDLPLPDKGPVNYIGIRHSMVSEPNTNTDSWDYMNFEDVLRHLRTVGLLMYDEFGEERTEEESMEWYRRLG
ncbi:hypothetical protein EG329_002317 [Mollisiaceae sp. DMI_Dod_QoI]|nr:hypothetical protein EG329_002317 [Helotiales sp. DMI_Dod_QoI]